MTLMQGGMDMTGGRYDVRGHPDNLDRKAEPADVNLFWGWHDNLFKIEGTAVEDLTRHFWQVLFWVLLCSGNSTGT